MVRDKSILVHVVAGKDVDVGGKDVVIDLHYLIIGPVIIPVLRALQEQLRLLVNVHHNLSIFKGSVPLFLERNDCKVVLWTLLLQNYLIEVHLDLFVLLVVV